MECGFSKSSIRAHWPSSKEVLKFNVDSVARGKSGPQELEEVFPNGIKDASEAEVLAILEALRLYASSFRSLVWLSKAIRQMPSLGFRAKVLLIENHNTLSMRLAHCPLQCWWTSSTLFVQQMIQKIPQLSMV